MRLVNHGFKTDVIFIIIENIDFLLNPMVCYFNLFGIFCKQYYCLDKAILGFMGTAWVEDR
jgi:hypothetical protein